MSIRPPNEQLREMLIGARVIAVVGHSDNPSRTSYQIAHYLRRAGYQVYAVNPLLSHIDGEKSYSSLSEVPEKIDIVNVFRRSEHLRGITAEAIDAGAGAVWGQLGVVDAEAADLAQREGMPMVMDLCIKIEHQRLVLG